MNFQLKYISLVCGKGRLLLRLSKPEKNILRRNLGNRMPLRSTRVVIRVNPRYLYIIIYQQKAKKNRHQLCQALGNIWLSVSVPTWWKKRILQLLQGTAEGEAGGRSTAALAPRLLAFLLCVSDATGICCVSSSKWLPASSQFNLINPRWMSQVLQITED